MSTNAVYSGNDIAGDIVIQLPVERIHPRGWGRLTWAWHALRGRAFTVPAGVVITNCVIHGHIREELP